MPIKKSDLYASIWKSCDELRGGMDASQYKDYVLTMLFLKYVSDKYAGELISNSLRQGESTLLLDDVELEKVVKDLVHIYKPVAEAKKITITTNIDAPHPFSLDNEKFKFILSNLISNALKFSDEGDTVSINIEIIGDQEKELHCEISDTGLGIPKEFIPTLFEKKKEHQRQGTGGEISTGMGLPIVKQFIELHNGEIKVESKEGVGTSFYILLPENS
ncbi:ATP-binding protein [Gracilimonas halophila]|uniref:histidine kinase n=1 Tax=Gracilimonas halophila TaxID=1834464 RepID=A0ABW5JFB8_9BACT